MGNDRNRKGCAFIQIVSSFRKEAQKCFCESANCRGYIGATESANILTDGTKITATNKLEVDEAEEDEVLEDLAVSFTCLRCCEVKA